jgi:hypothetical protein
MVIIPAMINGVSVTRLGDRSLQCRPFLTNVVIPDSVTNIDAAVFDYCTGLTNITIPDSVVGIGNSAFCRCTRLPATVIDRTLRMQLVQVPHEPQIRCRLRTRLGVIPRA